MCETLVRNMSTLLADASRGPKGHQKRRRSRERLGDSMQMVLILRKEMGTDGSMMQKNDEGMKVD